MTDKEWIDNYNKGMNALCRAIHEREVLLARLSKSKEQGKIIPINFEIGREFCKADSKKKGKKK